MFADRLKKARKAKGYTQERLAAEISVERSSVGKYESANVIPSAEVLRRIADVLDVSIDYLLDHQNGKDTIIEEKPSATDDDIKVALFGGDGEVTDEMWEEVKQFAEFVKKRKRQQ